MVAPLKNISALYSKPGNYGEDMGEKGVIPSEAESLP